ncbi:uncharacterized protein [Gossypium hirsutum]|uniref:Retrotransposon gag domain-containing protein n=1 Tax=Gossypium hirsutum TaxID=3635 RepID=A0A1U8PYB0_GOSHI|nr:uncharacterized protein LOC107963292 [Gossypium hirsutum]
MIDEWFREYMRNRPEIPRPPPPATQAEEAPRAVEPVRLGKAPVDKLRKYGVEEFRATLDDDLERAKFWLENIMRVLDDLLCTPEESLKCVVSLLKDTVYNWWKTISSVTQRETITWEFFQAEFKKKFISQRFLDQKQKEFLELKQRDRTMSEYERQFVRLSQYANEWALTEVEMCKRFDEGLNEEIKLLIGILEILEFATLADRAKKAEGVNNERKQAKREARVSSKRTSTKAHSFPIKKSRSRQDRSTSSVGYSGNAKSSKRHNPKSSYLSATNMGSIDDQRPKCMSCDKFHFGECRMKSGDVIDVVLSTTSLEIARKDRIEKLS